MEQLPDETVKLVLSYVPRRFRLNIYSVCVRHRRLLKSLYDSEKSRRTNYNVRYQTDDILERLVYANDTDLPRCGTDAFSFISEPVDLFAYLGRVRGTSTWGTKPTPDKSLIRVLLRLNSFYSPDQTKHILEACIDEKRTDVMFHIAKKSSLSHKDPFLEIKRGDEKWKIEAFEVVRCILPYIGDENAVRIAAQSALDRNKENLFISLVASGLVFPVAPILSILVARNKVELTCSFLQQARSRYPELVRSINKISLRTYRRLMKKCSAEMKLVLEDFYPYFIAIAPIKYRNKIQQ